MAYTTILYSDPFNNNRSLTLLEHPGVVNVGQAPEAGRGLRRDVQEGEVVLRDPNSIRMISLERLLSRTDFLTYCLHKESFSCKKDQLKTNLLLSSF